MTQAISVRCQHCGAPLQISDALRFITCGYCHTELQIVRDASTIHTEILSQIEAKTDALDGRLRVIEIQNEIERLDREWQVWRENNLVRNRDGSVSEPGPPIKPANIFAASLAMGMGVVLFAYLVAWPLPYYLFAPFVFIAALMVGQSQNAAAKSYESSRTYYENQRDQLLHRLSSARTVGSK